MAVEVCAGCSARYAVGLAACPQCGSTDRTDGAVGAVPPWVWVECTPGPCRAAGVRRRVQLRQAALNVVELPTLLCAVCGSELSITWPAPEEEDTPMPKITVHGGATNAAAEAEQVHGEVAESSGGPFKPLPVLTGDVEQDSTARTVEPDYEAWTVKQLREQLGDRGLPSSGKRDDLVLRLLEDDDTRAAGTE